MKPSPSSTCRFLLVAWLGALLAAAQAADSAPTPAGVSGVEYRHQAENGPQSIHVVSFDLARKDLALAATVGAGVQGKETVPGLVAGLLPSLGRPVAAINGDYFEHKGEPRFFGTLQGPCLAEGELVAAGAGAAFWVDGAGRPRMGRVDTRLSVTWPNGSNTAAGLNCSTRDFKSEVRAADLVLFTPAFGPSSRATAGAREWILERTAPDTPWLPLRPHTEYKARVREVRNTGDTSISPDSMVLSASLTNSHAMPEAACGDTLTFRTDGTPELASVQTLISGGPMLLKDGQILTNPGNTNRAPRTAIGLAGTRVWLVAVDGRQPDLAVGMSHHELAGLMLRLGCTDALNLDGGGSTTLWYDDAVMNSPSDGTPRPVGNALILVRHKDGIDRQASPINEGGSP